MGYKEAIEAAGAVVVEFKEFGSYQGDWFAILNNGNVVHGGYGSCGGCDAFQSEFGYSDDESSPEYQTKLANFGQSYLKEQQPISTLIESYKKRIDYDDDYAWGEDKDIYQWLIENFPEAQKVGSILKRYEE